MAEAASTAAAQSLLVQGPSSSSAIDRCAVAEVLLAAACLLAAAVALAEVSRHGQHDHLVAHLSLQENNSTRYMPFADLSSTYPGLRRLRAGGGNDRQ